MASSSILMVLLQLCRCLCSEPLQHGTMANFMIVAILILVMVTIL